MKIRLALAFFLVFILATTALGSHVTPATAASGGNKGTGGGWFISEAPETYGHKVTFSITAQIGEPVPGPGGWYETTGKFQLIDHATKTKVHGPVLNYRDWGEGWADWHGDCSVNGTDGYFFSIMSYDDETGGWPGDCVYIQIREPSSPEHPAHIVTNWYSSWEELDGGNIKRHDK